MVLWQHIVLCKSTLLGMRLAMVCVAYHSQTIIFVCGIKAYLVFRGVRKNPKKGLLDSS